MRRIKIANRTREIRPSGMKKGACGNVMHGLASLCHEAGNGGNNGRRCPKHARTVFLPDLNSKLDPSRQVLVTDNGNLGLWYGAWKSGDVFGTSVYLYLWNPSIGQIKSVYWPSFYKMKTNLITLFFGGKESLLIELSLEPWLLESIKTGRLTCK